MRISSGRSASKQGGSGMPSTGGGAGSIFKPEKLAMSSPIGKGFDSTASSFFRGCGAASDVLVRADALVAVGETGRAANF